MQNTETQAIIADAIGTVNEMSPLQTDGKWLEGLTVLAGPHIREWDVSHAYLWEHWPERQQWYPNSTRQDVGIDVVAVRRGDGKFIAIQCKARQLDEQGRGDTIPKLEIDKFISTSSTPLWEERWVVTNGEVTLSGNIEQAIPAGQKPITPVNIAADLSQQQAILADEECPHCEPNPDGEERRQSKSCMQAGSHRDKCPHAQGTRAVRKRRPAHRTSPRQNHPPLRYRQDPHLPAYRRATYPSRGSLHSLVPVHRPGSPD